MTKCGEFEPNYFTRLLTWLVHPSIFGQGGGIGKKLIWEDFVSGRILPTSDIKTDIDIPQQE